MKKQLALYVFLVTLVFGFASQSSASTIYTVQKGDSLWTIAKQFKVSFKDILHENRKLADVHMIFPNQKIVLPNGSTGTGTTEHSESDNIAQGNSSAIAGSVDAKEEAVVRLVNQERAKQGLQPLTLSSKLTDLAEMKAEDMASKNYFSHTSPTYGTPFQMLQQYGVSYKSAGENIAAGQKSAEEVMKAWMNSSGHRANILNSSYTEIGVGYYGGGSYGTEWVQLFIGK